MNHSLKDENELSTKYCKECEIIKSLDQFYKKRGLCKECYLKKRRKNNKVILDTTTKYCNDCKVTKSIEHFYKKRAKCKECYLENKKIYNKKYSNELRGFFVHIINRCKQTAKKRYNKGRNIAGICNITIDDLLEQFEIQKGLCYYTNKQLITKKCSSFQCSIERLNNNLGYIKNNFVFVCLEFNNQIQWNQDKIKNIITLRNISNDIDILNKINYARNTKEHINYKCKKKISIEIDNIKYYKCNDCNKIKSCIEYFKNSNIYCKDCASIRQKIYLSTIRGHLKKLFNSAKRRSINLKKKLKLTGNDNFNITIDDLINILEKQKGRCSISNIIMKYGTCENWMCSIERINNNKGYIKDNICLICLEFNSTFNVIKDTSKTNIELESAQWSKEKFGIFLESIKQKYNI